MKEADINPDTCMLYDSIVISYNIFHTQMFFTELFKKSFKHFTDTMQGKRVITTIKDMNLQIFRTIFGKNDIAVAEN